MEMMHKVVLKTGQQQHLLTKH